MKMKISKLALLVTVVFMLGIAVSGCGGGSDEPEELSKAQFIAKADAVCKKTEKRQEARLKAYEKEHKGALYAKKVQNEIILQVGLPPVKRQIEELREIGVPKGEEDKSEAFIKESEKAVAEAEKNPYSMVEPESNPFEDAEAQARGYGLTICGGA